MLLNLLTKTLDFIISLKNAIGSLLQLPSTLLQLSLELFNLGLQFLLHLCCISLHVRTLFSKLLEEIIDLGLQLGLHTLEFGSLAGLKLTEPSFVILNHGILLIFKEVVHFLPLGLMSLFHFNPLSFMADSHLLDFSLELVDQVTALRPKHLNLRLKICYLCFVLLPGFLSPFNLFLLLSLQLGHVLAELRDLLLKFLDLVIQLLYLFLQIAICCFQNVIQPFNFGVEALVLALILLFILIYCCFQLLIDLIGVAELLLGFLSTAAVPRREYAAFGQ